MKLHGDKFTYIKQAYILNKSIIFGSKVCTRYSIMLDCSWFDITSKNINRSKIISTFCAQIYGNRHRYITCQRKHFWHIFLDELSVICLTSICSVVFSPDTEYSTTSVSNPKIIAEFIVLNRNVWTPCLYTQHSTQRSRGHFIL